MRLSVLGREYRCGSAIYMIAVVSILVPLSACSLDEPSAISASKIELHTREFAHREPLAEFDEADVDNIARHYYRYSNGPAYLTVTYDPVSEEGSAMEASREAARIAKTFRKSGVRDINVDILPIPDKEAIIAISYEEITAHKPSDCGTLPGIDEPIANTDKLEGYDLGCSLKTSFAKQVSRPRDLLGQEVEGDTAGSRVISITAPYHAGIQNEPIDGEQSSGM